MESALNTVEAGQLEVAYYESGPPGGEPVVLMHGFPYSPHAYQEVATGLADKGYRVIVPFMRGYGPTRFLRPDTMRSGEQAAFGNDLIELMDALHLAEALLVGYDWGGRAACIAAARQPHRVRGLVSIAGYNIYGPAILAARDPMIEHYSWYHYYFQTHRARQALTHDRRAFCRYLWSIWSPKWTFDDEVFEQSAQAFDNGDFVDVVLHSYRHRYGQVPGDPSLRELQQWTEGLPRIPVPVVVLHGAEDAYLPRWSEDGERFTGPYERHVIPVAGHNLPQENPKVVIDATLRLLEATSPQI